VLGILGFRIPNEDPRDVIVDLPPGLVGNATAVSQCSEEALAVSNSDLNCPASSQVGYVAVTPSAFSPETNTRPLYNMVPAAGQPASFGFNLARVPVHLIPRLRSDGDYGLSIDSREISQTAPL